MRQYIIPKEKFVFDASLKTISFDFELDLILEEIYYISNVTDGIPIFRQGCENITGTVSGKILALDYNTTAMSDDDSLLVVFVENENITETLDINSENSLNALQNILVELKEVNKNLEKIRA